MIKEAIARIVSGKDLTEKEMEGIMDQIMTGQASEAQIGAFSTVLRFKGETVAEITGAARAMRAKEKLEKLIGFTRQCEPFVRKNL